MEGYFGVQEKIIIRNKNKLSVSKKQIKHKVLQRNNGKRLEGKNPEREVPV